MLRTLTRSRKLRPTPAISRRGRHRALTVILSPVLLGGLVIAAPAAHATAPAAQATAGPAPADQVHIAPAAAAPVAVGGRLQAAVVQAPPTSSWIGSFAEDARNTYSTASEGDLFPTCWASDDNLYTAWGDGVGFNPANTHDPGSDDFVDIGAGKITGSDPANLDGVNTALKDQILPIWPWKAGSDFSNNYYRKPTGMLCVGNTLYMAVQKMARTLDNVPEATIVKSIDGGTTWTNPGVMFTGAQFTTMWFADFGKGGASSGLGENDGYAYVYGIDGSWRTSSKAGVVDPVDVYLARVPKATVLDKTTWQFWAGNNTWGTMAQRVAVLHDERRFYIQETNGGAVTEGTTAIAQGGVTFNPALNRYIYSSWDEWGHHFFEAPRPWGPWSILADRDFTRNQDTAQSYSGYGTSLISKFTSTDGRTMWLQSNRCCSNRNRALYSFSLRKVSINPKSAVALGNQPGNQNLATVADATAVSASNSQGGYAPLSDGVGHPWIDDHNGAIKNASWWGYTWSKDVTFNTVSFTMGPQESLGGWYTAQPTVEVRRGGVWAAVDGASIGLTTTGQTAAGQTYTYALPLTTADGVRITGTPGGTDTYTTIADLRVEYRTAALTDGGFENASAIGAGKPWRGEGGAFNGIDRNAPALRHSGTNNGWIRTSSSGATGDQLLTQQVAVRPGATYTVSAWTQSNPAITAIRLGARWSGGGDIATVAPTGTTYQRNAKTFTVPSGVTSVTLVVGFTAASATTDYIMQLDDVALTTAAVSVSGPASGSTVVQGTTTTVTVNGASGYSSAALRFVDRTTGAVLADAGTVTLSAGSGSTSITIPDLSTPNATGSQTFDAARQRSVSLLAVADGQTLGKLDLVHQRAQRAGEVLNAGFEVYPNLDGQPWRSTISSTAGASIDTNVASLAHTGSRNAWIRTGGNGATGQQLIRQTIPVQAGRKYTLSAWALTSKISTVLLGASWTGGSSIQQVGAARDVSNSSYQKQYYRYAVDITVPSGVTSIDLAVGFQATVGATDYAMQIDDVQMAEYTAFEHNIIRDGGFESTRAFDGTTWSWSGSSTVKGLDGPDKNLGYHPVSDFDKFDNLSVDPDDLYSSWNAWTGGAQDLEPQYMTQTVTVQPGKIYMLSANIRTRDLGMPQKLGVRWSGGQKMYDVRTYFTGAYSRAFFRFRVPAGVTQLDVLVGWDPPGDKDYLMQIDDVFLWQDS